MHLNQSELYEFVEESNHIEGIDREPTDLEVEATWDFLQAPALSIVRVRSLVMVYTAGHARLRDKAGMNVTVGNYTPPRGGAHIEANLKFTLDSINAVSLTAYEAHQEYESLHPFTDGNGRSGRAIWLWQMKGRAPLGFLHHWYYQSLQEGR